MIVQKHMLLVAAFIVSAFSVSAQENQKYAKNGLSFEYLNGWAVTEAVKGETDEIALSNRDADAQITLMVVRKPIDAKDPIAESKKRVVDPWLRSLVDRYRAAGVAYQLSDIKSDVGGKAVDGVELAFFFDQQPGKLEAYWVLFDKRLVLLYIIRPDSLAKKADPGWDLAKRTLRIDPVAKK